MWSVDTYWRLFIHPSIHQSITLFFFKKKMYLILSIDVDTLDLDPLFSFFFPSLFPPFLPLSIPGLLGQLFHQAGFDNLHGMDQSQGMLDVSASKNIYTSLTKASLGMGKLPFDDNTFDGETNEKEREREMGGGKGWEEKSVSLYINICIYVSSA